MPELAPQQQPVAAPPPAPFRLDPTQLLREAVRVITQPAGFFAGVAGQQGLQAPLVFALAMGVVAGAASAVLLLLLHLAVFQAIVALVLMPVAAVIGAFVFGAIVHLVALAASGKGTYEKSFRVAAYATAVVPIAWPLGVLGWALTSLLGLVAGLYGFYVAALGVVALHAGDRRRTFIAMGAVAAIVAILGLGGVFVRPA